MNNYRPQLDNPIPLVLLIPTITKISGVLKKTYPDFEDGELFFGSFKTYGGTERNVNGIYSIEDTATIECWYDPRITSNCRITLANTETIYDIIGEPENINMRNQFLKFKVSRVKGGA